MKLKVSIIFIVSKLKILKFMMFPKEKNDPWCKNRISSTQPKKYPSDSSLSSVDSNIRKNKKSNNMVKKYENFVYSVPGVSRIRDGFIEYSVFDTEKIVRFASKNENLAIPEHPK